MTEEEMNERLRQALENLIQPGDIATMFTLAPPTDIAGDIERAIEAIRQAERTVVCLPELEEPVQTAVAGLPGVTVQVNPYLPEGVVYVFPTHLPPVSEPDLFPKRFDMPPLIDPANAVRITGL